MRYVSTATETSLSAPPSRSNCRRSSCRCSLLPSVNEASLISPSITASTTVSSGHGNGTAAPDKPNDGVAPPLSLISIRPARRRPTRSAPPYTMYPLTSYQMMMPPASIFSRRLHPFQHPCPGPDYPILWMPYLI